MALSIFPFLIFLYSLIPFTTGVIGGSNFTAYQYPWLVSIRYKGQHHCGGFIVENRFVVTSAHCVMRGEYSYIVVAREHNVRCDEGYEEKSRIYNVFNAPGYRGKMGENDVALLQLESKWDFDTDLNVAKKSPVGYTIPNEALLAGWGRSLPGVKPQSQLQFPTEANLALVANATCVDIYRQQNIDQAFSNNTLCFGNTATSACDTDEGSPILCGAERYVCGIFNVASGCGKNDVPGIFQNMAGYWPWIEAKIRSMAGRSLVATKDPAGMQVTTCGGFYETTSATIKLQGLSPGQKCHFAMKTPLTEIILNLTESTLQEGDKLTVNRFCKAYPCERISMMGKVGRVQSLQSSLVIITVHIGKTNPTQPKGFSLYFNSTGGDSTIPLVTGFTVLNNSDSGTYSHPTKKDGKYGNNEYHLVVLDAPKEAKHATIRMKEVDIEGPTELQEECIYDAVSVYAQDGDWYRRVKRVCGNEPPGSFKIRGGFGIMSMLTDEETVGKGFTFDYSYK